MRMKKFTLFLTALLMISFSVLAQIKMIVHLNDAESIELYASSVDSITFTNFPVEPDDDEEPFIPDANNHEYVDLGLPSGTLWSTMNLGADSINYYGDLYAWGDIEPKQDEDIDSSRYYTDGVYTKYYYRGSNEEGGDNKTVLELSDDAANANWGGDWRMPTVKEFQELVENCTWDWIEIDDVEGSLVTGPNGNTIFLPAAGCSSYSVNLFGNYWSSSLDRNYSTYAYTLDIESDTVRFDYPAFYVRSWGRSVRPILPTKSRYSIKFDANGGYGSMSMIKANYADVVTISNNEFSNGDYEFIGWNTKADGSGISYTNNQTFSISSDLTLYAQWGGYIISGYENGYAYADLGLPSGTKWATMNVGADSPEDYGDYFAWGETSTKSTYSWSTYKWMTDGMSSWDGVNKYTSADWQTSGVWYDEYGEFIGDGKTTLDLEDDAANANWGSDWRMPTKEEQDELRNNCTWTWSMKNGIKGYSVTGPNGNSIFLPAAGGSYDSGLDGAGSYGDYWSSSLYSRSSDYACYLSFISDGVDWYYYYRNIGRSVRPVLP